MKRAISFLLVLVMLLGILPMAAFAEETEAVLPQVTLTADKKTVKAGEDITLTLSLSETLSRNVTLWQWDFVWDSTYFTAKEGKVGDAPQPRSDEEDDAITPLLLLDALTYYTAPYTAASVSSGNAVVSHKLTKGTIATVTLTAKEDITDNVTAKFFMDYIMLANSKAEELAIVTNDPAVEWGTDTQQLPADGVGLPVTVTSDGEGETDPDPTPTTNGYTVTLDEKKEVTMDETVSIDVKVGHTDETVTTYNAFDMTFSYDSDVLELTSTAIEGLTVIPGEGTVRVQGYGPDREIDSTAFTLTFRAKTTGNTAVKVTTPKVDRSASAIKADAPEAVKTVDTTNVTIGGYPVNLPEDFTGATVVEPNTNYTFTANNKNYNYTFEGTTMGEETAEVIDNGNGTFTIKNVSGKINVVSEKTPKSFKVTLGTDMKGDENAQYMTDYEATLTEDKEHYTYTVSVTIGGEAYTGYGVSEGKYTIPGKDIIGDIVFTVTKTPIPDTSFKVSFEGNGAGDAEGSNTVAPNASYSFKLNKETGYKYDITAKMGSSDASFSEDNGTYTFAQVTGDLVITITKTLDVTVTVHTFVELDGKTVFLVAANATLGEGKALTYNGTTMFYSDGSDSTEDTSTGYNAWCYLVIVEENTTFTEAEAIANIGVATSAYTTLADTKDVNESGKVDINDAQLVYDIYNHKYVNFDTVSMQKFLKADVNHDRSVNVTDAAAVVTAIE